MLNTLFEMIFGCTHRNYSFPITAKRANRNVAAAGPTGTYVVCLDCGKEFAYDWEAMKVIGTISKQASHAPIEAVEGLVKRAA
ncbi:MAG: hypothetical protein ROO76_09335 [Terriglobia bacterium]|jgi:hypothetical protein|nr:hypothetical protein [Terriglobia bacterium]